MPIDLQRIGSLLEEERKRKGLSIAEVSDRLALRKTFIEAIERGDLTRLPHEVYVRGYVREYAKLLGVLPEIQVLLREKEETETSEEIDKPKERRPRFVFKVRRDVLFLLCLVAVLVFFSVEGKRKIAPKREAFETIEFAPQADSSVDTRKEVVDRQQLLITCHERTWMSVIIDGKEKKEFMLNPGELVALSARDRFDLLIGNAGGIRIFLNGKDLHFSGESGEVRRLSLP